MDTFGLVVLGFFVFVFIAEYQRGGRKAAALTILCIIGWLIFMGTIGHIFEPFGPVNGPFGTP